MEAIQETTQDTAQDELRPEYDITSLRVRKVGPGRAAFGSTTTVTLEPDVAAIFPNAAAVNEALRSLIKVTKDNTPEATAAS